MTKRKQSLNPGQREKALNFPIPAELWKSSRMEAAAQGVGAGEFYKRAVEQYTKRLKAEREAGAEVRV